MDFLLDLHGGDINEAMEPLAFFPVGAGEAVERQARREMCIRDRCYTTCAILALAPLLAGGIASGRGIVVDAKSGVTGAGKKPSTGLHYCEVDESMKAYGVATHQMCIRDRP